MRRRQLEKWLLGRPALVIDLETTGLDPRADSIVEIGACLLLERQWGEQHVYQTLVRPETSIKPEAAAVHGLTMEDLSEAPNLRDAIVGLESFCPNGALIAGHNVGFDFAFLREAYARLGIPFEFDYHTLDIWSVAFFLLRARGVELPSYNLDALCRQFGISRNTHHNALQDALASASILRHLYSVAQEADLRILSQVPLFERRQ